MTNCHSVRKLAPSSWENSASDPLFALGENKIRVPPFGWSGQPAKEEKEREEVPKYLQQLNITPNL